PTTQAWRPRPEVHVLRGLQLPEGRGLGYVDAGRGEEQLGGGLRAERPSETGKDGVTCRGLGCGRELPRRLLPGIERRLSEPEQRVVPTGSHRYQEVRSALHVDGGPGVGRT